MALISKILDRFKSNVGGGVTAPPAANVGGSVSEEVPTPDNVKRRPFMQDAPKETSNSAQPVQQANVQPAVSNVASPSVALSNVDKKVQQTTSKVESAGRPKVLKPLPGDKYEREGVKWGQEVGTEKPLWKPTTHQGVESDKEGGAPPPIDPAVQGEGNKDLRDVRNETTPKTTVSATQEESDADREVRSYNDLLRELKERAAKKPLSPEEEKRKKRDKVISGIGDALASVANLYFTTQGAPNMYDPKRSLSEAAKTKWDEIAANNEKIGNERLAYMIRQYELLKGKRKEKEAKEAADAKLELLKEQMEGKMGLDEKKLAAAMDYQKGRLENEKERNNNNKERNSANKELSQARLEEQKRHNRIAEGQGATRNAIARQNANTRAAKSSSSGSGERGSHEWQDKDGYIHYAPTEKEAIEKADANGTLKHKTTSTKTVINKDYKKNGEVTTVRTEERARPIVDRSKVPQKKTHQAQTKKNSGRSGKANKPLSGFTI